MNRVFNIQNMTYNIEFIKIKLKKKENMFNISCSDQPVFDKNVQKY